MPESAKPNSSCPDLPPELARHPKYRILRELGRGGMGVVYQARQTGMMDRQVVIKVINRSLIDNPEVLARFRREVQAAAQLSHPNIVTAYNAEQAGDLHLLVMELVPGQNLADVLDAKGPLPVTSACHYIRQAARALQHAHERGMVHRDIKPENLMLTPESQIKVLDFGIAKVVSEQNTCTGLTASNSYVGTPEYSAPEQATDAHSADIRADLYSLGCTLYCLLAGRPPFQEATAMKTLLAHLQKEPPPLAELRPDVPEGLCRVVSRLLAKEPRQRYQTPIEVMQALTPFVKPGTKPEAKSGSMPVVAAAEKGTLLTGDSYRIKNDLREEPGQTPSEKVPAQYEASPLLAPVNRSARPRKAKGARQSTRRASAEWYRLWLVLAGVGVLLVLLGIWASGVFKVKTKDGSSEGWSDDKGFVPLFNGNDTMASGVFKVKTKDGSSEGWSDDKGFVPLFNGNDTTGWTTHSEPSGNWRVEKGILLNSGSASGLYSERDDYKDFHLRVELRINNESSGGVHFRAPFAGHSGYRAYIDCRENPNNNRNPTQLQNKTGGLGPGKAHPLLVFVRKSPVRVGDWFKLEIIAKGDHLVIKVNGKTTADYKDFEHLYTHGHILLGGMIEFRKIEIKELK